jgi:hypothetical protein
MKKKTKRMVLIKIRWKLGTVVHTCSSSNLEAEGGGSLVPRNLRLVWAT